MQRESEMEDENCPLCGYEIEECDCLLKWQ